MVGVVFVKHSQHNSKLMECWDVGLFGCRTIGSSDYQAVGLSGCRNIRLYRPRQVLIHKNTGADEKPRLRLYVLRKSDLPLHIGQIHAFYFDTTLYSWIDDVNTKSDWLNNLIDVCIWYCIETTCTTLQTVVSYYLQRKCYNITGVDLKISLASLSSQLELADTNEITPSHTLF